MFSENLPAVEIDVVKHTVPFTPSLPAARRRPAWMLLAFFLLLVLFSVGIICTAFYLVHGANTPSGKKTDSFVLLLKGSPKLHSRFRGNGFSLPETAVSGNVTIEYGPSPEFFKLIPVTHPYGKNVAVHGPVWHNLTDEQLLLRASAMPSHPELYQKDTRKIALLFLTRGPLPLALVWDRWLKGQESFYSLYVHPKPGFKYGTEVPEVFRGREIPSQEVEWGTMSVVDAERRLLANALLDADNQRFVLLSETCIPLWNFTYSYRYLMDTNVSFMQSFDDPGPHGRGRYDWNMRPEVEIEQWRKGSQWFEFTRQVSHSAVADTKYYSKFLQFCVPHCYVDEHYFPTMLCMTNGEDIDFRSVTWVNWAAGGWHPRSYHSAEINEETISHMRGEPTCTWNGTPNQPCFLFARKLEPNTLTSLLMLTQFMGH